MLYEFGFHLSTFDEVHLEENAKNLVRLNNEAYYEISSLKRKSNLNKASKFYHIGISNRDDALIEFYTGEVRKEGGIYSYVLSSFTDDAKKFKSRKSAEDELLMLFEKCGESMLKVYKY